MLLTDRQIWLVSLVQLTGVKHSSTFQLISTILKVILIVAFLTCGFVIGTPQRVAFAPQNPTLPTSSAPVRVSLVFVMYSFSGWNAATYIIGEMKLRSATCARHAVRRAGRAGALCGVERGVPAYRRSTSSPARSTSPASPQPYLRRLGGRIVGGMICIGLVSSISAMMWIGPR
jgi:APA family basic amino acid/polyamine antiporter